jgi:hypothetical protein
MTKEEIIDKEILEYVNWGDSTEWVLVKIRKSMDEYAKHIAIGFVNFSINGSLRYNNGLWWKDGTTISTEQLFNQYLETRHQTESQSTIKDK